MFKKCAYFFIPFLLCSSTYSMDTGDSNDDVISGDESAAEVNYDKLSQAAKGAAQALAEAAQSPNKKAAKRMFATRIGELVDNPALADRLSKQPWDPSRFRGGLFGGKGSKSLQNALKVIQENSQKGQEDALLKALAASDVVTKHSPVKPAASKSSHSGSSSKARNLKDTFEQAAEDEGLKTEDKKKDLEKEDSKTKDDKKDGKTDTPDDKTPEDKDKKSNKPTISQGFPLGRVIAITGVVGAVALIYHKYSKSKEQPTRTA